MVRKMKFFGPIWYSSIWSGASVQKGQYENVEVKNNPEMSLFEEFFYFLKPSFPLSLLPKKWQKLTLYISLDFLF